MLDVWLSGAQSLLHFQQLLFLGIGMAVGLVFGAVPGLGGTTALALLLFFLVVPVFTFLLHPLTSLYSRKHEYEADAYAAKHAVPADLIRALVKLYQDNAATLTPAPLYSSFYDSHPPALLRVSRLQAANMQAQPQPA